MQSRAVRVKDVASAHASVAVSEADRDHGTGMTHQKANRVTCDQASPEAREYADKSNRNSILSQEVKWALSVVPRTVIIGWSLTG